MVLHLFDSISSPLSKELFKALRLSNKLIRFCGYNIGLQPCPGWKPLFYMTLFNYFPCLSYWYKDVLNKQSKSKLFLAMRRALISVSRWRQWAGLPYRKRVASHAGAFLGDVNGKENQAADIIWAISRTGQGKRADSFPSDWFSGNVVADVSRVRFVRFTGQLVECTWCTIAPKLTAFRPILLLWLSVTVTIWSICTVSAQLICRHG